MHLRSPEGRPPDGGNAIALMARNVSVRGGLDDISISLPRGQRLALIGPRDAGQTTVLLAVAGLLPLKQGTILTDGRDVTRLRPAARGIGVSLLTSPRGPFAARRMRQLAPTAGHGLLVLEHPEAWPEPGRTVLATFADQTLALSGADRIAIMRNGRVVQEGPVAAVYETPRSSFVARFLGGANIIAGTVRELRPGGLVLIADGQRLYLLPASDTPRPALGVRQTLALRPERIALLFGDEPADNVVSGTVLSSLFQGASVLLSVETPLGRIDARLPGWRAAEAPAPGAAVRLGWAADAAVPVAED